MILWIVMTVHVRWPAKTSGAFGFGLNFLCYFLCFKTKKVKRTVASRQKEWKSLKINIMFFLLLVQKKEPKKSTPALIYSHCRMPWVSFSATVDSAKQFLSSTSTIIEMSFVHRSLFIIIKREFTSAFFFVDHKALTSLKNVNEKDSAFRCFA